MDSRIGTDMKYCFKVQNHFLKQYAKTLRKHQGFTVLALGDKHEISEIWDQIWNEHGTIYAISSDFGDRMTTQHLD